MDNNIKVNVDTSAVTGSLQEASVEITRIASEEIAPAAALIEDAFSSAARTIESQLARAARSGELSLKGLGRALFRDLRNNLVDGLVRRPIENLLTGAFGAFGGARAAGGFVAPGASFLVGERGPEIFTPSSSGTVSPNAGAAGVTVNISLPGVSDRESFQRSQTQIAAGVMRAMSRGQRNL